MKTYYRIVCIAVITLLAGCAKKQVVDVTPIPLVYVTETDRALLRNQWIEDAENVARKSGVEEALLIANFLRQSHVLTAPMVSASIPLESNRDKSHAFSLIPLVVGDEKLGAPWDGYISPRVAIAHYIPTQKTLIIKVLFPFSPTWRGIIMIHEGNHARTMALEPYDWQDNYTYCHQELITHRLQNEIASKIGGRAYDDFVTALADEMEKKIRKQGGDITKSYVGRSRHYPELDVIFGPPLSDLERNYRETSVSLHATFLMRDRLVDKEKADEFNAFVLLTMYRKAGILK